VVDRADDKCHKRKELFRLCRQGLEGLGLLLEGLGLLLEGLGLLFCYIKDAHGLLENGFQRRMGGLGRGGNEGLNVVVVLRISRDGAVLSG